MPVNHNERRLSATLRKRILFVTGSMGRGGAERVISLLSDYYVNKGYKVDILLLLHSNASGYRLNPNVGIIDISNDTRKALLDIPRLIIVTRKILRKVNPDTIVCFMAQNILITGLANLGLHYKLIVSERIDPAAVKRNFLFKLILNRIYATCDKTIFQTKRARSYFPKKVQANSVIIPNPVSVECFAKDTPVPKIVTAGRLTEQKNQALLINAFFNIVKVHPEFELYIYGVGPQKEALESLINNLGLNETVRLMGNSDHLHKDISDASLFVLPSNFEGLSNVLLESMMMGIPTISTDCAGSDEVIVDGYNGLLVPVGNQEKLETAIINVIEDRSLARNLSKNGKKDVLKNYSINNIIAEWNKVIE